MGGTDDPSNLVHLTVEEHAQAHQELFEKYGRWQDELAYKGLLGIIGKEQIIIERSRRAGYTNKGKLIGDKNPFYGKNHTLESRKKMGKSRPGIKNPMYGRKHSDETKSKMSKLATGRKLSDETKSKMSKSRLGIPKSPETKSKMSKSQLGKKSKSHHYVSCVSCHSMITIQNFNRHVFSCYSIPL